MFLLREQAGRDPGIPENTHSMCLGWGIGQAVIQDRCSSNFHTKTTETSSIIAFSMGNEAVPKSVSGLPAVYTAPRAKDLVRSTWLLSSCPLIKRPFSFITSIKT